MSSIYRKLAIAKSFEKLRKVKLDKQIAKTCEARKRVDESKSEIKDQKLLIDGAVGSANNLQQKNQMLSPNILESQTQYFTQLYADLEALEKRFELDLNTFSECQLELMLNHAKNKLASKNTKAVEKARYDKAYRQEVMDNLTHETESTEFSL